MVSFRLQSILASMAKYYWILHYLSLLLSRLKHSFICKGVIGQNADIHYRLCAQDEIRRTHVNYILSRFILASQVLYRTVVMVSIVHFMSFL